MLTGLAALLLFLGFWVLAPGMARNTLRERTLDASLTWLPREEPGTANVAIVDIDRAALAKFGPWPWPRVRLAELVAAVMSAHPAALALDILLAGKDRFAAGSLVERPSEALMDALPDGDRRLAEVLATAPSALGFGLGTGGGGGILPATPVLVRGPVALPLIWRAAGIVGPVPAVAAGARGFGALVAEADPDGPIRRVPLLVLAGGTVRGSLAVETARLAGGADELLIEDNALHAGAAAAPLDPAASLRLVQPPLSTWQDQTIAASSLLENGAMGARLEGKIVLIGSSAPELGGLRVTPASPVTPSVQIQAEAVRALLSGFVPYRPFWLGFAEVAGALCLGLLGLLLASWIRPLPAACATLLICLAWVGAAIAAVPTADLLADPAGPPLVALLTFAVTALARFVSDEWRSRLLRASFEQHLAPDVVRRIAADPTAVRLAGEQREITAIFTDIEGFTAMTERADPADLVALLDAYFDSATRVVTEHGGMVAKIAGDAVNAIFNAPFVLPDHPARAFACALALARASEAVRVSSLGNRLELGRTRVGVETGLAIVGDVGGARKLDYTAYGNVMNTAARLEGANKELGTTICIGPGTASRLPPDAVREIGTITLRGQSVPVRVFVPIERE